MQDGQMCYKCSVLDGDRETREDKMSFPLYVLLVEVNAPPKVHPFGELALKLVIADGKMCSDRQKKRDIWIKLLLIGN